MRPAPNGATMVREERAAYAAGDDEANTAGTDLGDVRVSLPEG
jgi:hypothetical protein